MEAAVICSIMISDNCGHLRAHSLGWCAISTYIIVFFIHLLSLLFHYQLMYTRWYCMYPQLFVNNLTPFCFSLISSILNLLQARSPGPTAIFRVFTEQSIAQ